MDELKLKPANGFVSKGYTSDQLLNPTIVDFMQGINVEEIKKIIWTDVEKKLLGVSDSERKKDIINAMFGFNTLNGTRQTRRDIAKQYFNRDYDAVKEFWDIAASVDGNEDLPGLRNAIFAMELLIQLNQKPINQFKRCILIAQYWKIKKRVKRETVESNVKIDEVKIAYRALVCFLTNEDIAELYDISIDDVEKTVNEIKNDINIRVSEIRSSEEAGETLFLPINLDPLERLAINFHFKGRAIALEYIKELLKDNNFKITKTYDMRKKTVLSPDLPNFMAILLNKITLFKEEKLEPVTEGDKSIGTKKGKTILSIGKKSVKYSNVHGTEIVQLIDQETSSVHTFTLIRTESKDNTELTFTPTELSFRNKRIPFSALNQVNRELNRTLPFIKEAIDFIELITIPAEF